MLYNRNILDKPGGGVCLCVNSLHSVSVCDDIVHADSLFVEINVNMEKEKLYCRSDMTPRF